VSHSTSIPKRNMLKKLDISGFYFLDAESEFKPDQRLLDFLYNGPPPLYIGYIEPIRTNAVCLCSPGSAQ
jgi:hypothetical protein